MSDYGQPLQFGLSVTPTAAEIDKIGALVDAADATNLDLVAIQDHAYNPDFLDTWTLIAILAARTNRVRFFSDVADVALRPPAVMAKAAASLDRLSGGRIELGLGAGAFWDAIVAMGGPQRTPAEAVDATRDAIEVIRLAWTTTGPVSFEGRHYHLRDHQPGPSPVHPMAIWLGAVKPRMLRLTGELTDGWVSPLSIYVTPEQIPAAQAMIDDGALGAGRAPSAIRRIYNVVGMVGNGTGGRRGLHGSVDLWVDTLTHWATELGLDTFIFWPSTPSQEQVNLFAGEVVPRVREQVAARREDAGRRL